ncbi:hypothetical protein [Rhizobium sp. BK181]|uniref:hypothetical protein n=1 Tax=Rhizobium sp. BK181 TaxID=2587072 RepID=UPI0039181FDC
MQALEKFLGTILFERLQRSVKVTRVGEHHHLAISGGPCVLPPKSASGRKAISSMLERRRAS